MLSAAVLLFTLQTTPATGMSDRLNEPWWKDRHERCVRMTKYGRADVAFLGDSITQGWEGEGESVWDTEVAPYKAANFGFSGDRTDHVLWRLNNGELIGMHPRLVVLMIGTNNLGQGQPPEEVADGVKAVVATLLDKLPRARVLLLGIFPRGTKASDDLRMKAAKTTDLFKSCADGRRVVFLDFGSRFLQPDGRLPTAIFPDLLHPNAAGYEIWSQAIQPDLNAMLLRRS